MFRRPQQPRALTWTGTAFPDASTVSEVVLNTGPAWFQPTDLAPPSSAANALSSRSEARISEPMSKVIFVDQDVDGSGPGNTLQPPCTQEGCSVWLVADITIDCWVSVQSPQHTLYLTDSLSARRDPPVVQQRLCKLSRTP